MSDIIPPENGTPNVISAAPIPLTVEWVGRRLTMHYVSSSDLDTVASLGNSIHLTFFGLCAGAAITSAVVLTTVALTATTRASYVAALVVSGVMALYFGIRGVIDYFSAKKRLRDLKSGK